MSGEEILFLSLLRLRSAASYRQFAEQFHNSAASLAEKEGNNRLAKITVSRRQFERWRSGHIATMPLPDTCKVLESMFGRPVQELFRPADPQMLEKSGNAVTGPPEDDLEGTITMAARRARSFAAVTAGASNVSPESVSQLEEEAARLARAYPVEPLAGLLPDLIQLQSDTLTLLEGRQPPKFTRALYLVAGLAAGMLAKASHDRRDPATAMVQARLAWQCADNSGHGPLSAWVRGLESLIQYWAKQPREASAYAQAGLQVPGVTGTVRVWLWSLEARARAALGQADTALTAIGEAQDARSHATPDDLDGIGGMCTFESPRQDYYAADAGTVIPAQLAGTALAADAARWANQAIRGYTASPAPAFGDLAGSHAALAIARIRSGEIDGAAEAIAPVLDLPPAMRINGVLSCALSVHRELSASGAASPVAADTQQAIEAFAHVPSMPVLPS